MLKNVFRVVLLMLCVQAAPCLAAADVQVLSATFGVFEEDKDKALNFDPRIVVPHQQDQRYGWVIELNTKKKRVSVREEYLLPSKQKGTETPGTIAMERRNQVSQRALAIVEGKIYGIWSIGPGEPAGHRHLQVFVEGELAGDFEFDVR